MLAEYDENGSLTTLYTRGDELISQERNGVKSYYLYDGFDSVRMLTDGEGIVTDTYTFDAFGNLTIGTRRREKPINIFHIPCFQEAGDFIQKQDLKNFV